MRILQSDEFSHIFAVSILGTHKAHRLYSGGPYA
jgi:hypothetical protein